MDNTKDAAEGSDAPPCYPFLRSPAEVRVQWMRLYGLTTDEIVQSLTSDPPIDVAEEEKQLDSIVSVREMNADKCRLGCVVDRALKDYRNNSTADY